MMLSAPRSMPVILLLSRVKSFWLLNKVLYYFGCVFGVGSILITSNIFGKPGKMLVHSVYVNDSRVRHRIVNGTG